LVEEKRRGDSQHDRKHSTAWEVTNWPTGTGGKKQRYRWFPWERREREKRSAQKGSEGKISRGVMRTSLRWGLRGGAALSRGRLGREEEKKERTTFLGTEGETLEVSDIA